MGEAVLERGLLELDLGQLPLQVVVVGLHVEVPVPGQVEQDDPFLARLAGRDGLLDRRPDGVRRLRAGDEPLRLGELDARFEHLVLRVGPSLHVALADQDGERGRVAVVPEAARVHRRRDERVPQRVHRDQGGQLGRVAEVVRELPPGQRGARRRLRGDEPGLRLPGQPIGHERVREPGVVRTPAYAPDDHIRVLPGHLHLLLGLQADHGLVHQDVVEHRAQRVVRVFVRGGDLEGLADRDAE